jgi:hypothetical protein
MFHVPQNLRCALSRPLTQGHRSKHLATRRPHTTSPGCLLPRWSHEKRNSLLLPHQSTQQPFPTPASARTATTASHHRPQSNRLPLNDRPMMRSMPSTSLRGMFLVGHSCSVVNSTSTGKSQVKVIEARMRADGMSEAEVQQCRRYRLKLKWRMYKLQRRLGQAPANKKKRRNRRHAVQEDDYSNSEDMYE